MSGERAVQVALVLGGAAGEVQQQVLSPQLGPQAKLQVRCGRLEHVLGVADPVCERRQRCARAPLGVVEHGVRALAQAIDADPCG
jgi:hypothetical protein